MILTSATPDCAPLESVTMNQTLHMPGPGAPPKVSVPSEATLAVTPGSTALWNEKVSGWSPSWSWPVRRCVPPGASVTSAPLAVGALFW